MRVLLTTDVVGGVWTYTRELATGLLKRGCTIYLLSFGGSPDDEKSAWCKTLAASHPDAFFYKFCPAPLEWMQENDTAYEAGAAVLQQVIARFLPDLLHLNQFCFAALPLSIPKLVTAHSDVISWALACRKSALEPSPWLRRYKQLVQHGLDNADALAAPSLWMLHQLAANFEVPRNSTVIYNGCSIPLSAPSSRGPLTAIVAGRLSDTAKGFDILRELRTSVPILAAGKLGPNESKQPLPSNVTLLGELTHRDLLDRFRSSSVYLLTSTYEPFGLAAVEAARCGCAVLARDTQAAREIWSDGALYFRSASDLEAALEHLSSSPGRLRQAQIASQSRAQIFSADKTTSACLALYSEFCALKTDPVGAHAG